MMNYAIRQLNEVSCREIAAFISDRLIGCRAINTSFDSGLIVQSDWESVNGFPVSPQITNTFVDRWPTSHLSYCDEWWIFDGEIPADFKVNSFCNFVGTSIADLKDLSWEEGWPLDHYLELYQPLAIFGNNKQGYLVIRDDVSDRVLWIERGN